jgi:hypothetical protein
LPKIKIFFNFLIHLVHMHRSDLQDVGTLRFK